MGGWLGFATASLGGGPDASPALSNPLNAPPRVRRAAKSVPAASGLAALGPDAAGGSQFAQPGQACLDNVEPAHPQHNALPGAGWVRQVAVWRESPESGSYPTCPDSPGIVRPLPPPPPSLHESPESSSSAGGTAAVKQ
jgi:hypothetical protein